MYSILYDILLLLMSKFPKKVCDIDIVEENYYRQNYVPGLCTPPYYSSYISVCIPIYLVKLISVIYY